MKVLCSGDIHIGRGPTRLGSRADAHRLSCAAMWESLVSYAIDQHVDLLALSGDVVDRANRYFEAAGPLERGLRRLADAGVQVVAVAGNHDFDVLPEIARGLPGHFRLLGTGGAWERVRISARDGSAIDVDGWSFPMEHVRDNPVARYALPPSGVPVLGLLHADLDLPGSSYAPVSSADLRARPVSFWLLGHVHAPALHDGAGLAPLLYPGSPQPMDPGETGVHGAWLLTIANGRIASVWKVPLASVRYAECAIDLTGVAHGDVLREHVMEGVRCAADPLVRESEVLRWLVLRLRLTGRTAFRSLAEEMLANLAAEYDGDCERASVRIDRVQFDLLPPVDLGALARGAGAPGVLARLLLTLDAGRTDAECDVLVEQALGAAHDVCRSNTFLSLTSAAPPPDPAQVRTLVRHEAARLLDALLRQQAS